MDYKQTASEVLKYVGGKSNISHFEHCSTRLRFTLVNQGKADVENLRHIPGVIAVKMTGQCQVVIGNEVIEVYDEVYKLIGDSKLTQHSTATKREKQKLSAVILDFIVGVFQPLVPAIAGGGVLKSLLLILTLVGLMDSSGQTYKILNYIGDATLYFLPLLVAATTANKLKVNYLVAVAAVGALVLPNMSSFIGGGAQLFGLDIKSITYAYQVFPAILTVILFAYMEKFFTKISPKPIRVFFVPMMSLLITVPIALLFLGPLGYTLGQGFSHLILTLFSTVGWIATALLAAVLPLMVATGMHKAMIPYAVTTMGGLGKEILYLPASLAHNISEAGACFGIAIRTKDKLLRSTAISAGISALCGITEPALYGVTLQNKKVLGSVMAGSLIGGAYIGITQVEAFVLVGPGIPSLSMFISDQAPSNFVNAIIGLLISFGVSFAVALILGKDNGKKESIQNKDNVLTLVELKSPVLGKMVPLSEVNDDVFSSKTMGEGFAINPQKGKLYAPVDGTIKMLFDTNHALGLETENGAELLFHVGIDTVQLGGQHFESRVKAGDVVKAGDLLLTFDLEKIISAGFDPVTIVVVTNQGQYDVEVKQLGQVELQDTLMYITAQK